MSFDEQRHTEVILRSRLNYLEEALGRLQAEVSLVRGRMEFLEGRLALLGPSPGGMVSPATPPPVLDTLSSAAPQPVFQRLPPDPSWVPVIHRAPTCHQPAFYLIRRHARSEAADLSHMRVARPQDSQWRAPAPTDEPCCSACLLSIDPYTDRDLIWDEALLPPITLSPATSPHVSDLTGRLDSITDALARARSAGIEVG